jgi:hypothetical protein
MIIRRLTLLALAAAFALSSSLALLQSARPALAEPDHNARIAQNQRHDRDDWNRKHNKHANNSRWHGNNGVHNGQHKRQVDRDRH